jgi:hypothetical protein
MADTGASPQHSDEGTGGEIQTPATTTAAAGGQNIVGQEIEVDPAVVSNSINPLNEGIVVNLWQSWKIRMKKPMGPHHRGTDLVPRVLHSPSRNMYLRMEDGIMRTMERTRICCQQTR